MSKRIIQIAIAFLLFGLTTIYFLGIKKIAPLSESTVFNAIKKDSPLIIKLNNPGIFVQNISDNAMLKSLCEIPQIDELNKSILSFRSILNENDQFKTLLKNKPLIIACVQNGSNEFNSLGLILLNEKAEYESFENALTQYCKTDNITTEKIKVNKVVVTELIDPQNGTETFAICFHKGVLLIGKNKTVLEEGIHQLNAKIEPDEQFLSLLKTASKQSDLNVFINYKTIDQLFSGLVAKQLRSKTLLIKTFSQWSEFDIQISDLNIVVGGFSSSNRDKNYYSNILYNQQTVVSMLSQVLPYSTLFYLGINVSDASKFFSDYDGFLEKRDLLQLHNRNLTGINDATGINIRSLFEDIFDNETAIATIQCENDSTGNGNIWVVRTKSGSHAIEKIVELQKAFLSSKNIPSSMWQSTYKIDNQTTFQLFKFPFPELPKFLFGEAFGNVSANWVAVYNNYLLFGDSFNAVSEVIHANVLGQTLSSNIEYAKFQTNLSAKSNINFYSNTSESGVLANLIFNEASANTISGSNDLKKFKYFAWQISSSGKMLYHNSYLEYNPEIKLKTKTVWQSKLNSNATLMPKFVRNPSDPQNMEILLQDEGNILYLINNVGRIVWQLQLEAAILSEICPIEAFRNGKILFLFNTENKIYLIDRNGNSASNFPITLRAKATNGVSVFDYENNRNFRYFIACSDKYIYAYDEAGNLLDGWEPFKTDHVVQHPVQHLRVEGKDYIVATDEMKDYFLHRKGTVRIETKSVYPHSANNTIYVEGRTTAHEPRFVTTDNTGKLHYTYLDGTQEEKELNPMSENHFFVAANVDTTPDEEYIFADSSNITVYNSKSEIILNKHFNSPIANIPQLFSFSSKIKRIGITISQENKIYLFDINGELYKGFPFDGCSPFDIAGSENTGFNLSVGSPDGYLYYYYIE